MRSKGIIFPLFLFLAVAVASGCRPEKPDAQRFRIGEQGLAEAAAADREADELLKGATVATVGGVEINGLEVKKALGEIPPPSRYYYSNPEKVALFTQSYALILVYAWLGASAGKVFDPYVKFLWEEALVAAYRSDYLQGKVDPAQFTDQEADAWLTGNADDVAKALGTEKVEPEEARRYARLRMTEARENEIWQGHLAEVSKELGFELPPVRWMDENMVVEKNQ